MKIEIKNRWSGTVLFAYECEDNTIRVTLLEALNSGSDLRGSNLSGSDLRGSDLRGSDLSGSDLRGSNLSGSNLYYQNCPEEGDFIAFKKLAGGVVAKLLIPADAKRNSSISGRKCRAEFVKVLEGEGRSLWDHDFIYKPGDTARPDSYNPDPRVECSHGIHFFISRQEAETFVM